MNRTLKRTLCLLLSLVLLCQAAPVMQVDARQLTLPEIALGEEILSSDVFYLASAAATLQEGANTTYLLRVGRGGTAESEASVLIKISDMTAQYGTDYTVAAADGSAEVEIPEENFSLIDLFLDSEYEQSELKPEEEAEGLLENDPEAMEQAQRSYAEAFNVLAEMTGFDGETDTAALDEVSQARNLFTGVEGTNQHLTTTGDTMQKLQDVADVMTELVPGAGIRLTFAPGESEKFLLITPEDNHEGDGDRTFYLILSDPTGTTTNSAASSCACTIADDEVQTPSVVHFSQDTYSEIADGMLRVTLERESAMNTNVSVTVRTVAGSAQAGRDYAEVDRELFFPFGISSQYIDIPVRTDFIEGEADFGLELLPGVDCTVEGEANAVLKAAKTRAAETEDEDPALHKTPQATANNLLMVRTLPAINIEEPCYTDNTYHTNYCGHNEYDASKGAWALQWDENDWLYDPTGKVSATWKLTDDDFSAWIAGARVTLETTANHGSDKHHSSVGIYPMSSHRIGEDWECAYKAQRSFGKSTIDFYMTEAACNGLFGTETQYLSVVNDARCEDCNWLYIYSIEPILRPFQGRLLDAEPMPFLQEDGTYRAFEKDVAVKAEIKGNIDGKAVYFLDDSVTVLQPGEKNVIRYAVLTGLDYIPGGNTNNAAVRVATITDKSMNSIEVRLTKDMLTRMFVFNSGVLRPNDNLLNTYKSDPNVEDFYKNNVSFNYPTYGDVALRPVFEYIDAKVTLQNPLDVPICYTISGTEYWLAAKDSIDIPNLHVGDTLAITDLRVGAGYELDYKRVGVNYDYKFDKSESDPTHGSLYFSDEKPIYIGDANKRLCYQEVVIQPVFTEKDNQIVVQVRTTDVSKFEENGLFQLTGTRNGAYTEYVIATPEQTIPGKVYNITATPKNSNQVCVWTVFSGYRYVGDSFIFESGVAGRPEENVIQLTVATAASETKLTGTLTYMDYNLHSQNSGGASARPAVGAAIAAGTMYAVTDEEGRLSTNTMKIPTNPTRYRVRCLISVNGASVLKDIVLAKKNEIDISQTFDSGLSPVLSPIYSSVRVTCDQADFDGLIPMKTTSNDTMTFKVYAKPVVYTSQIAGKDGKLISKTMYEKPLSVQLVSRDAAGVERRAWDVSTEPVLNTATGEYEFTCKLPYVLRVMDIAVPTQPDYEQAKKDETVIFAVEPGDTYYLRLTTDLLDEVSEMEFPQELLDEFNANYLDPVTTTQVKEFTYSDVNTGLSIYPPPEYTVPVKQGLTEPIQFEFANFELLSNVGMNFQFPFVNIGYMQVDRGYRIYIGVSVTQILDKIYAKELESPISKYNGDDGTYWGRLFSMAHPFATFASGLAETWDMAFNQVGEQVKNGTRDVASLGAAQWRFEFVVGVYFDFFYMHCTDSTGTSVEDYVFSGIGGYVSVTVGFKKAWYTILPVVFIPAYFGIEIKVTGMGFFGVQRDDTPPEIITFDDATTKPEIKFENQFNDEFNWALMGYGTVQVSLGVGLCGTIGIRVAIAFDAIVNYEPSDVEGIRDWGVFLDLKGGLLIDAFLGTIPIWYTFHHWKFGKFEDFEKRSGTKGVPAEENRFVGDFRLRTGSEETSEWVGESTVKRGAFTPKQTYTLVNNGYEHAEPQLITLKNGTVVLAYLANDPAKGAYQRTTLMITTYKDGVWKEPIPVSNDGTADFQPSIAETGDGRVLLAWVSTEANDISEATAMADYLRQMEVFAAFAEIGEDGAVTVGETQRITRDQRIAAGETAARHYYDANPTVVCDTESGDAIVYYIKSGSATTDGAELANPYVNDSVICYLPYDSAKGKWMTDEFYEGEISDPASQQYLINNFCGQRFLDAPTFETPDGGREYYAIPDFTAIGYDGLAVYAYTVDRDSSNDTDTDKELLLQVYSFKNHYTYRRVNLTNDVVPDALPQFVRTAYGEDNTVTKLFWYRNGNVCYIDVSNLLREGINPDGTLIPKDDGSGTTAATPILVATAKETSEQNNQMANFRVAQDAQGRLYVLWTEAVRGSADDVVGAQEVFAVGYNVVADAALDKTTSWSKPYQLTRSGVQNDEVAITLVGDDLMLVHNQYEMEVTDDANEPLKVSSMRLAATTLAPCGSVVTDNVTLRFTGSKTDGNGTVMETPVTQALPGDKLTATLTICNNGLTTAEGYRVDVYAVMGEEEQKIWSYDSETRLLPNRTEDLTFEWELPSQFDGMTLRVDTRENKYSDVYSYETEAFEASANYRFSELRTYQADDGFHLTGTLTNIGNAATGKDEELSVVLSGPYDLPRAFTDAERVLYRKSAPTLRPGENCTVDLLLDIPAAMLERYGYVKVAADVSHEVPFAEPALRETVRRTLGSDAVAECSVTRPLHFTLLDGKALTLNVGQQQQLNATLELPDHVGGSDVVYSVADPSVAAVEANRLTAAAPGETEIYATHVATGATVSVHLTVKGGAQPQDNPFADVTENAYYYAPVLWAYYHDPQITQGVTDNTFAPGDATSRAQAVTFLWRVAGKPEPASSDAGFTDVAEASYYAKAVRWAVEEGITVGTSKTTFSPEKACSRGEFVTFLYRMAGRPGISGASNPFSDVKEDAFYSQSVFWAVEQEVTAGTSTTTFSPEKLCTRGEIMTFLYRYLEEK